MEKNAQSNFQNSLFGVQEREGAGPASFLQARGPGGAFDVDSTAGGPRPQPACGGANLAPVSLDSHAALPLLHVALGVPGPHSFLEGTLTQINSGRKSMEFLGL